jgi:WD40 repeat protein
LLPLKDKILVVPKSKDILIINKYTFKVFSFIKNSKGYGFFSATKLPSNRDIACCGDNGIISIFRIQPILCQLIQKIPVLDDRQVYRIKEISNNKYMSNQDQQSLIFYEYNKEKLKITNKIIVDNYMENFLHTKNNDILLYANFFSPKYHYKILLFDTEKLEIIKEVLSCNGNSTIYEPFSFLTKNIVAIVIAQTLFLVDINKDYTVISQIESSKSEWIYSVFCLDHNKIVTGDEKGNLILWNYDKNIINKIADYKIKDKDYYGLGLTCLMKLKNNLFFVGGESYLLYAFNFFENKKNQ